MHLVLIETSGNQRYIFATNKLKENVGASELTLRAGSRFVIDAVCAVGGPDLRSDDLRRVRDRILDPAINRPIEHDGAVAEVVYATSGKALVLVRERTTGLDIVRRVTGRCLKEAPGVEIRGAVVQVEGMLEDALSKGHTRLDDLRGGAPAPEARFLRLPIVEECSSSGMPAAELGREGPNGDLKPRSRITTAKRDAAHRGWSRIQGLLGDGLELARNMDDLDSFDHDQWMAVVHADGNGLGRIFLAFREFVDGSSIRTYVDALRRFSTGVEECTEEAFRDAAAAVAKGHGVVPVVPIVVGGDDVTVICEGRVALKFAVEYLKAFETRTSVHPAVAPIAARAFTSARLSACAGVAIVKAHFPFYSGYTLAEQLCSSAKRVKTILRLPNGTSITASAVDFHVHYDSSGSDLGHIRSHLVVDGDVTSLLSRPYVITKLEVDALGEEARGWLDGRNWNDLETRVGLVNHVDAEGERTVPGTVLHLLRDMLRRGCGETDRCLNEMTHRYPRLQELARGGPGGFSLFQAAYEPPLERRTTFLDTLEASPFWN